MFSVDNGILLSITFNEMYQLKNNSIFARREKRFTAKKYKHNLQFYRYNNKIVLYRLI